MQALGTEPIVTWTYSGNPSLSGRDAVRFLVGDTEVNDQLLQDEEIDYLTTLHGTLNHAAAEAAHAIAAKFARLMHRSIGGLSADFSAKYHQYMELAEELLRNEGRYPVGPFVSGFRRSEKELIEDDTDRETTFGRKGIHDNQRVYPADDYGSAPYRAY